VYSAVDETGVELMGHACSTENAVGCGIDVSRRRRADDFTHFQPGCVSDTRAW
jgi:hypothetical protein